MNYERLGRLIVIGCLSIAVGACSGSSDDATPERDNAVIQGVNFVGLSVADMQTSTDFYKSATDLTTVASAQLSANQSLSKIAGRSDLKAQMQLMKSSNSQLLFMQFADRSEQAKQSPIVEVHGPGIAHVCYQVNEETKSYDRFLEAGATHIGDRDMVQLNPRNPVKYAYARDLDGATFEVEHVDVSVLDLPEPPKNDYRIRHVSLATNDMGRITKFYSKLLQESKPRRAGRFFALSGEKLDKVSGLPDSKIKMAWFQVRNLELEIIEYVSHSSEDSDTPRPLDALGYNMIVFDVRDIEEARKRFLDAGGEIVSEVESLLGGDVLFGRDPDGNLIGLQAADPSNVVSSKNFLDNGI